MNPHLHGYTPATPTWGTRGGPCCRRDDRRAHADSQPRAEPEQRQPFIDRTAHAKPDRHGLDSSHSLRVPLERPLRAGENPLRTLEDPRVPL
jgi:hypothetical protein